MSKNKHFNEFITAMLKKNALTRIFKLFQVKQHLYYAEFNWDNLINLNYEPPYFPTIKRLNYGKSIKLTDYLKGVMDNGDTNEFNEEEILKLEEWWKGF